MRRRLTDDQVRAIRQEYSRSDITQHKLGRKYGISGSMVGNIISGECYAHVRDEPEPKGGETINIGHPAAVDAFITALAGPPRPTIEQQILDELRAIRALAEAFLRGEDPPPRTKSKNGASLPNGWR
jgi:hypothetical protein